MSTVHDEKSGATAVFVSGAIIGAAIALLFVRMQNKRAADAKLCHDDYYVEGGDMFV